MRKRGCERNRDGPPGRGGDCVVMKIWILTDGKIGDCVQCAGVAALLGADVEDKTVTLRPPFEWLAPFGPIDPRQSPGAANSPIAPPFPDIAIASGRRAIAYARVIKRESGGATFVVLLKDPRIRARFADLIWAPQHDRRAGDNVFSTLTSPHGLGPSLDAARNAPAPEIAALAKPVLGVVLGGVGGSARYDAHVAADLAAKVAMAASSFASVAVTPSRRTPDYLLGAVRDALSDCEAFVWSGAGKNPYRDILAAADALIVTGDSHNMVSEALATGRGVYAYRPPQLAPKLAWFLDEMEKAGAVRAFKGSAGIFENAPIDTTQAIADEVRRRLKER